MQVQVMNEIVCNNTIWKLRAATKSVDAKTERKSLSMNESESEDDLNETSRSDNNNSHGYLIPVVVDVNAMTEPLNDHHLFISSQVSDHKNLVNGYANINIDQVGKFFIFVIIS
jgi:hypothetical protein